MLFFALLVALRATTCAQAADVAKTNPMKVYMHYMPWFETPASWAEPTGAIHWKMNTRNPNIVDAAGKRQIASHYYPKIGPYDSSDPDVIEYHMLLDEVLGRRRHSDRLVWRRRAPTATSAVC